MKDLDHPTSQVIAGQNFVKTLRKKNQLIATNLWRVPCHGWLLANIYQYAKASAFKQLAQPKFKDNKATSSPEFRSLGNSPKGRRYRLRSWGYRGTQATEFPPWNFTIESDRKNPQIKLSFFDYLSHFVNLAFPDSPSCR